MGRVPPWARGPLELLCEAQVNLDRGDDVGRRIALILFDDALEASISTYLGLHPIQRGNRIYSKTDVENWLANFHSKLDFLQQEIAARGASWVVERPTIVWSHDCRNEQYHGGRKGTPEQHVLADARQAALWVFSLLLEVADPESALASAVADRLGTQPPQRDPRYDRAIDAEHGVVVLNGERYYASELLFAADYAAYTEAGMRLMAPDTSDVEEAE